MSFARQHKQRSFSVLEGKNIFEYIIKKRAQVLETGTFTAEIATDVTKEERNASWINDEVCANSLIFANVMLANAKMVVFSKPNSSPTILKSPPVFTTKQEKQ